MIRYKDKIFPEYFIDPVTAIITNSKGEVQETYILRGRPYFKGHCVHEWQVHTHIGYKRVFVIHHLDENKLNNSLSNLVYLSRSEHMKIHMEGKHMSEETKRKISESKKGEKNPNFLKTGENHHMFGKHLSEETKHKMSEAKKNMSEETKHKMSEAKKDTIWINNGVISKRVQFNEEIPAGFIRGRLKKMNEDFIKLCYEGFKKNDKKFPDDWTLDDYKKYKEECDIILEKENEEKTF